jgi:alkylation response protein AidB-like acyl-CoA dehydrogenase
VRVDTDRLIGEVEGQGLAQAQQVFGYTRLMVAAFGLGGGWAALDRAIEYSTERIQAGTPLSQKQGYTHKLIVPHVVHLEASRALIEDTAERIDAGEGSLNTEGAIAKYLATEFGNAAAEAAIQAHGGYGYTREYMVEKIKRDVRITTIYEGTSEIMEWTIARDRWQLHLKSRGQYYLEWAKKAEARHAQSPSVGAGWAAAAMRALAALLERARLDRLTRNQHVLFRLGELIAYAETAALFAERAAAAPSSAGGLEPSTLQAMARIHARDAALRVATEGLRWGIGAGQSDPGLAAALHLEAALAAQAGLVEDMDVVARDLVRAYPAK